MNTYTKYAPNVFVAKCNEKHEKGDTITVTTRHGKENESIVFNYLGQTKDGCYLYSIVRADGFNVQEWAKRRAEKLQGYAANAEKRGEEYYKKADLSEKATGIPFGQPILVGHHSERAHRKVIERADNAMRKNIEERAKAKKYESRAEYWEAKANDINLSMPESLEFYEYKLHQAEQTHKFYKENPDKRKHSYSLTYANKAAKEAQKNLELAVKLWGDDEQINQIAEEKRAEAEAKATKSSKQADLLQKYGGFFAFNNDQFREGYAKAVEAGHVEQGEKVTHVKAGLYIPSCNVKEYMQSI